MAAKVLRAAGSSTAIAPKELMPRVTASQALFAYIKAPLVAYLVDSQLKATKETENRL